jgi:flagellar M-ring protein FliF
LNQLLTVWNTLDPRRRVVVLGSTLAVFLAVLALGRMATQPGMALLYAGLEGAAAGEVVQALEQRSVAYEVRGDAIYVPLRDRDEMRMTLASQGLPATGSMGYELLDGLSGFGTTSQMFDAAYWRAKEGELARTIAASPHIRSARVHIAMAVQQPFRREVAPTASVTVTPVAGTLPAGQARALQFLVASAVSGLRPEDVSVIDGVGGMVLTVEDSAAPAAGGDRETVLRRAVERLLEAHVGPGRALVEVSIDTETDRESIIERRLDPEGRVAVISDTEERSSTSADSRGAGVTVASNLPDGDAASDNGRSQSQNAETRARLTYDVSEIQRELHRAPGAVRRLTVAVLVDGVQRPDASGAMQWQPRPEAELEAMRELVASAVGFDATRGDIITLKSLPFEPVQPLGSEAGRGGLAGLGLDLMSLAQLAVLAVVTLALILFVIRPVLAQGRRTPHAGASALPGPVAAGGDWSTEAAPGDGTDEPPAPAPMPLGALPAIADLGMAAGLGDDGAAGGRSSADPVSRLRRLIEDRQEETVEILRSWMEDGEEETT